MEAEAPSAKLDWRRILIGGILGTVVATAANEALHRIVLETMEIPASFDPLHGSSVIVLTFLGTAAATGVLLVVNRFAKDPWRLYQRVAFGALLLSFVPDVGLLVSKAPGATGVTVGILMVMHVVAFAVIMASFYSAIHWHAKDKGAPTES